MAAGGVRNTVRRFVPRRIRWLIRVPLRLASGYYLRRLVAEWRGLSEQVASQSAAIDAQGEVMYLLLRRMRSIEDEIASLPKELDMVRSQLAGITEQLGRLDVRYGGLNSDDDPIEQRPRPAESSQHELAHPVSAEAYLKDE